MTEDPNSIESKAGTGHLMAGRAMREMHAGIRKLTFTGNRALRRDSGSTLRPQQQLWSATTHTPVLFEGLFCIPVVNVDVRLVEPLSVPARMTITGTADNGMIFSREFTFPAGRPHREVAGVEADRPAGGVFDRITKVAWKLTSEDISVVLEGSSETRHNIYFVPRWEPTDPPLESVISVTCDALRGLGPGHQSSLDRLWRVIETLDVPAAGGTSRLVCSGPERRRGSARDLLRSGQGGAAAWLDFFRACVALGNSRPASDPSSGAAEWPWTVDSFALKEKLLEAKCQHTLRGQKQA